MYRWTRRLTLTIASCLAVACSDGGGATPGPENELPTLAVVTPDADLMVASGATLSVEFVADDPDGYALTDLFADRDGDLATTDDQRMIATSVVNPGSGTRRIDWKLGSTPPGVYWIMARVDDRNNEPVIARAPGRLTINARPRVVVHSPLGLVRVSRGYGDFTIEYSDNDPDDNATTSIYADVDGDLDTTGDQLELLSNVPEQNGTRRSFVWDLSSVPDGSYHIVARTTDGINVPGTSSPDSVIQIADLGFEKVAGGPGNDFADALTALEDGSFIVRFLENETGIDQCIDQIMIYE